MEITNKNLILNDVFTEEISKVIDTYCLSFNDKEIRAIRFKVFNSNLGEIEDNFEFETNLSLTEKDKEVIEDFCLSQE